jgi:hypothetical protein
LWEYSYFFSGFNFQTNQGFSVYFDATSYTDLQNVRPSGSPDWNLIAVQRDVLLQAPGYLDGLALVNAPAFQGPFQVAFVWLGWAFPAGNAILFQFDPVHRQRGCRAAEYACARRGLMLFGYRSARLRKRG